MWLLYIFLDSFRIQPIQASQTVNKISKCFTIVHTIYAQKLFIHMFKYFNESPYLSVSAILCLGYNLYINHEFILNFAICFQYFNWLLRRREIILEKGNCIVFL